MSLRGLRATWRTRLTFCTLGAVLAAAGANAATASATGSPTAPSTGQAAIADLTITAVVSPAAGNLLYPGGTGDAVVKITNPNAFPVTLTAVQLPANTAYAAGYRDLRLSSPIAGCAGSTPSGVRWNFATRTKGSSHLLASPLTVAANGVGFVTLTKDVTMESTAPAACAGSYFALPALTGVTAGRGTAGVTRSPGTDAWTS